MHDDHESEYQFPPSVVLPDSFYRVLIKRARKMMAAKEELEAQQAGSTTSEVRGAEGDGQGAV